MLALQKHWEAVQACLADEICLAGLKQNKKKCSTQETWETEWGGSKAFPYGREWGTAFWSRQHIRKER